MAVSSVQVLVWQPVVSAWLQPFHSRLRVLQLAAGLARLLRSLALALHLRGRYLSQSVVAFSLLVVRWQPHTNLQSHAPRTPTPNTALQGTLRDKAAQHP
jgi:hypothetical protein